MGHRRLHVRAGIQWCLAVVAGAALVGAALPASAQTDYFVGGVWQPASPPTIDGTTADIYTDNPTVSVDVSAAWTMVVNPSSGDYAQDGWVKYSNDSSPYYFYEYNGINPTFFPGSPAPSVGTTNAYTVVLTSGTWNFEVNYQTLASTSSDAFSPTMVEDLGEVHNTTDQSPGGYNTQVTYSDMEYYGSSGWQTLALSYYLGNAGPGDGPCGSTSSSTAYQYCYYSSSTFDIWDSRYPT